MRPDRTFAANRTLYLTYTVLPDGADPAALPRSPRVLWTSEHAGQSLRVGACGESLIRLVLNDQRIVGEERLLTDLGSRIAASARVPTARCMS